MPGLDDLQSFLTNAQPGMSTANDPLQLQSLRLDRKREAQNKLAAALGVGDTEEATRQKSIVDQYSSDLTNDPMTGEAAQETAAITDPRQIAARAQQTKEAGDLSVAKEQGPIALEGAKTAGQMSVAKQQAQIEQQKLQDFLNPGGASGGTAPGPGQFKMSINAKGEPSFAQVGEPQQIAAQAHAAQVGLPQINTVRQIVDSLDKRGMVGPIMGRVGSELVGSGFDKYFLSPDTARAMNDFKTQVSLLKSNLAYAHGAARGGASPAMQQRFDQLLNLSQSPDALRGGLDAAERWLTSYANAKSSAELDAADAALGVIPGQPYQGGH